VNKPSNNKAGSDYRSQQRYWQSDGSGAISGIKSFATSVYSLNFLLEPIDSELSVMSEKSLNFKLITDNSLFCESVSSVIISQVTPA
jgi:hypothetical protein